MWSCLGVQCSPPIYPPHRARRTHIDAAVENQSTYSLMNEFVSELADDSVLISHDRMGSVEQMTARVPFGFERDDRGLALDLDYFFMIP